MTDPVLIVLLLGRQFKKWQHQCPAVRGQSVVIISKIFTNHHRRTTGPVAVAAGHHHLPSPHRHHEVWLAKIAMSGQLTVFKRPFSIMS